MQAQDTSEKGKTIFNQRCAACHKLEQKLIGPPLARISERRSEAWFVKFVSNSQAFIQSGDAQAVAVFKEYNQQIMPPFTDLSEADIKSIWSYLNSVAAPAQSSMASANAASPSATQKTIVYPGEQNTLPPSEVASLRNVFWIITGVVVLVALLIGVVIHFASLRGSSSA
ncbi:MAG: cytochrome c [Bacteroidia bacterium]|nr:cytochrome c [Bacteroidia bacterium]MDW8416230.1 cytochrome c [Bacteroidia bacterium]